MRKLFIITNAFVLGTLALVVSLDSVYAQEKSIKLRYSNFMPPGNLTSILCDEWCNEIEKKTNGRVKITHFPGNTLSPPTNTYNNVVKGIIDVGMSLFAYSAGRFPMSDVLTMPLGVRDAHQGQMMANAWYKKFKPKELDDTKVMYIHGPDHTRFTSKKVLSSFDDLKGLRLLANSQSMNIVKVFDASPVILPTPDSYDALHKGVVDGMLYAINAMESWKLAELTKTTLESSVVSYMPAIFVVMNKDKWNSISKEDHTTIEEINEVYADKQGKLWDKQDNDAITYSIGKGHKFVKVSEAEESKAREKLKPVFDEFVTALKAKGFPAEESLNFCRDFLKKHP